MNRKELIELLNSDGDDEQEVGVYIQGSPGEQAEFGITSVVFYHDSMAVFVGITERQGHPRRERHTRRGGGIIWQ